jgi:probable F420-dependent oxidoreductase
MSNEPPVIVSSIGYLDVHDSIAIAQKAEQVGFGGVSIADHLFMPHVEPGRYPYSSDGNPPFPLDAPWPDAWALASAVAAVTSSIEILTSIYILPLRHPLIVARAAGTAAIIARGRLTMGVGVGWLKEEFDAVGVDFERRGSRANEAIEALRALWSDGPVTFKGRFFSFGPLFLEPSPPTPIPIIVGGTSEAALRRAVRLGQGYILPYMATKEEMFETLRRLDAALAEAHIARESFRTFAVCRDRDSVDDLCRFADAGVNAMLVRPWLPEHALERKLDDLERYFQERVMPVFDRLGFSAPGSTV